MNEGEPKIEAEHIPTPEEVHSVFRELTDKPFSETDRRENSEGLYFLEVTMPGDAEGETIEYSYTRKGRHETNTQSSGHEIQVTYYKDGVPYHGTTAARYVDGNWKIIK